MSDSLAVALLSDILQVIVVYAFAVTVVLLGLVGTMYRRILIRATFDDLDSSAHEEKTNCPSCGARTTAEPDECDHCGDPLSADAPPDYGWADEREAGRRVSDDSTVQGRQRNESTGNNRRTEGSDLRVRR